MLVSQKCQYALRAVFQLAKRYNQGPTKIADIAQTQAIPARFLEVILSQLKHGGFVESRRGKQGGYFLVDSPAALTVGKVVRFMQGPIGPVACVTGDHNNECPLQGECVFLPMWESVRSAIAGIYDSTSIQDLVNREEEKGKDYVPNYVI